MALCRISAFFAGAVSLEQGAALIIGQNIGTATSSALAAIGASVTAKRLALAYVLFKLIAALIAIIAFPLTTRLMQGLSSTLDGTTLLAAYHTAYNVIGVAVLLPAARWFASAVTRMLPSRETPLERALDPSALASPVIAIETARRVVADVLKTTAVSASAALAGHRDAPDAATAAATLDEVRRFLSSLKEPPETGEERFRLTSTLHALDHAARLAGAVAAGALRGVAAPGSPESDAAALCEITLRNAQFIADAITAESALSAQAAPIRWGLSAAEDTALAEMAAAARKLQAMQRAGRASVLAAVAPGALTASEAFARIETMRQLDQIASHAWRTSAHLLGQGGPAVIDSNA